MFHHMIWHSPTAIIALCPFVIKKKGIICQPFSFCCQFGFQFQVRLNWSYSPMSYGQLRLKDFRLVKTKPNPSVIAVELHVRPPPLAIKMRSFKTGGPWWQVPLHCNVGPSARNIWSFKTDGLTAVVSQDRFHCNRFVCFQIGVWGLAAHPGEPAAAYTIPGWVSTWGQFKGGDLRD